MKKSSLLKKLMCSLSAMGCMLGSVEAIEEYKEDPGIEIVNVENQSGKSNFNASAALIALAAGEGVDIISTGSYISAATKENSFRFPEDNRPLIRFYERVKSLMKIKNNSITEKAMFDFVINDNRLNRLPRKIKRILMCLLVNLKRSEEKGEFEKSLKESDQIAYIYQTIYLKIKKVMPDGADEKLAKLTTATLNKLTIDRFKEWDPGCDGQNIANETDLTQYQKEDVFNEDVQLARKEIVRFLNSEDTKRALKIGGIFGGCIVLPALGVGYIAG